MRSVISRLLALLCVCLLASALAGSLVLAKDDPAKLKALVQSTGDRLVKATLAADWDTFSLLTPMTWCPCRTGVTSSWGGRR